MLYPIEIKVNSLEKAFATNAFTVLDKIPEKKRGTGAIINPCFQPGMFREDIFEISA